MARLILDTGVLIDAVRGRSDLKTLLTDEDDVSLPVVVVAEYLVGVHRDHDPARKAAQRAFLAAVLNVVPVEPYDLEIANSHAELLAHTRANGQIRGSHDLIIAATAIATNRTLLTTDKKAEFHLLPGIDVCLIKRA